MMEGPPLPPLPGVKVGLDGERYVEMIRPLDVEGGDLTMKSRLIGIHKRGSGASVETEVIIFPTYHATTVKRHTSRISAP